MERPDIKEKLYKILSIYVDSDKVIGKEEELLVMDSLLFLEVITVIESEFHIVISDEEVEYIQNFKRMMEIVTRKLG